MSLKLSTSTIFSESVVDSAGCPYRFKYDCPAREGYPSVPFESPYPMYFTTEQFKAAGIEDAWRRLHTILHQLRNKFDEDCGNSDEIAPKNFRARLQMLVLAFG